MGVQNIHNILYVLRFCFIQMCTKHTFRARESVFQSLSQASSPVQPPLRLFRKTQNCCRNPFARLFTPEKLFILSKLARKTI